MSTMRQVAREQIELHIPASEEALLVVRLTASGVASPGALDMDALEDFKTAVHEACFLMIHQPLGFERLGVKFTWGDALCVSVTGEGERVAKQEEIPPDADMCRIILESLVTSANLTMEGPHIAAVALCADVMGG